MALANKKADAAADDAPEGMVPQSERPHPDDHAGGQTPAVETDQLTAVPVGDLNSAIGEAVQALTNLSYNQSQPDPQGEELDEIVDKLEAAIKAAKHRQKNADKAKAKSDKTDAS